ncbi:Chain length determinant protein [Anatilimnocola aggregata]|uniref:Chain length determinant protein n=1 Tax=Anatilimnocola aggregata TaxID=2528021 RepID=A0A517YA82_9BACT|nr:GumC family protein [Anatilimnocola aggregata]QDU27128.1 Chain length determinant protein [Anatilimnocola aggregata]
MHATQPELLVDLLEIFNRHRIKMAVIFMLVLAGVTAYTLNTKRLFTSEAKLFVRLGRETIGLDPTATTNQVISVQDSRENEVNSIRQLLQSRAIAEEVVDEIGFKEVLELKPGGRGLTAYIKSFSPFYVDSPRDAAIDKFRKRIKVLPVDRNSVIAISYQGGSPELSQQVLTSVIASARKAHLRVNRIEGSGEFFSDQSDKWRKQVSELEKGLTAFRNESGVSDFGKQRDLYLSLAGSLKTSLLEAESQLQAANAQLEKQEFLLADEPDQLVLEKVSGLPNTAVQEMRQQLYAVQLKEQEILSKYNKEHDLVRQIQDQIKLARRKLEEESDLTQVTEGLNTARQELRVTMLTQKATVAALAARTTSLREKLAQVNNEIKSLNQQEPQLDELQRELQLARDNYLSYSQKNELARIEQAMNNNSISNINVLQAPSRSLLPSWPQPILNLALGVALGMFSAMCVALIAEYRRPQDTTPLPNNGRPAAFNSPAYPAPPHFRAAHSYPAMNGAAVAVANGSDGQESQ